jgi:adenylosuccinate synthase
MKKKPFPHAKIKVSNRAHLILPFHKTLDALKEVTQNIGTTKRGIGPSYSDKVNRQGCRVASLLNKERFIKEAHALAQLHEIDFDAKAYYEMHEKDILALLPNIIDVSKYLDDAIKANQTIMFEGAQGVMLDISHGTYPYVTSSSPSVSGIPSQVGMAPWLLEGALGIVKAYSTRVGEGPFPTEIHTKLAHQIREVAHEYGVTTGRPRRIGYLDLVSLRHAVRVSGITHLAITLLDLISEMDEIKVCNAYDLDGYIMDEVPAHIDDLSRVKPIYDTLPSFKENISAITSYENLPEAAKTYLDYIQKQLNVKIAYVSVGPKREQTIQVENIWEASRD